MYPWCEQICTRLGQVEIQKPLKTALAQHAHLRHAVWLQWIKLLGVDVVCKLRLPGGGGYLQTWRPRLDFSRLSRVQCLAAGSSVLSVLSSNTISFNTSALRLLGLRHFGINLQGSPGKSSVGLTCRPRLCLQPEAGEQKTLSCREGFKCRSRNLPKNPRERPNSMYTEGVLPWNVAGTTGLRTG